MQAGMKRRPSEEMGGSVGASTGLATPIGSGGVGSSGAGGAPSGKKLFILAGPWDLGTIHILRTHLQGHPCRTVIRKCQSFQT